MPETLFPENGAFSLARPRPGRTSEPCRVGRCAGPGRRWPAAAGRSRSLGRAGSARHSLLVSLLALWCGCAAGPWRWRSPLGLDHPLTGRIWDVSSQAFVTEPELFDRLAAARFVLLGEQHLNPDHHGLQGRVIRALVERRRKPAVVMEMLDTTASDAIAACESSSRCTPARFAEAVAWNASGWPDWHLYEPILRAALDAHLPIAPGSPPGGQVREFARTGELPGGEPERRRLGLDQPLDPAVAEAMAAEIRESHCGYAPEEMLPGMVEAQRLRDAHLAESLLMAAPMGRAVLIAGFGHVRLDRGVPVYLARSVEDDRVVSLAFLEVEADHTDPTAYAAELDAGVLPFDYVWFTPRLDDVDPCERFRKSLEKIRS